jgi:hypothetical protein
MTELEQLVLAQAHDEALRDDAARRATFYPDDYRACPVCKVPLGEPCVSLSGRIVGGRPDGARTELSLPHTIRKLRIRRKKATA